MDDIEHKGTAKDLFKMIVHSPALLVTAVVGIGLVAILLIKKGGASTSTTPASDGTSPTVVGVRPQYIINAPPVTVPSQSVSNTTPTTASTTPAAPTTATVTPTTPAVVVSKTVPHTDPIHQLSYTDQSGNATALQPYLGLLGANVAVNFQNRTYTENGKQVALPNYVGKLIQGSQNRVWYIDTTTGKQDLLTSGIGAGVTNSGYAPNSPQNS